MTTRLPTFARTLRSSRPSFTLSPTHPTARTLTLSAHRGQDATKDKKDALFDKDAINTSSNEYSKTGGGDASAAHTDKAFDPGDTDPESQHGGVKEEAGGDTNPIDVSPGSKGVNQPNTDDANGRSEAESKGERKGVSGGQGPGKGAGAKGSGVGKK